MSIRLQLDRLNKGSYLKWSASKASSKFLGTTRPNVYVEVHYKHILESDAILIVNIKKNDKENYIGGNVLIEMGQAFVNDKKIFLTNNIPTDSPYADEIISMDPICLEGKLENIKKYK